jgi:ferritin-like metal-binding protein YciE
MSEQMEILQGYVNDMLAVEHEMHQAFRRQKHSHTPSSHPASAQLIGRIEDTIDVHIAELRRVLERLGGSESALKAAVGKALGAAAGIYNQIRSDRVSTMVRDDLTALNFAVACYQMLHTTALAMHDQSLADVALRHIKDFTPQIMDLSEVLPAAVLSDLEREQKVTADDSVAEEARKNTREAWTQGPSVH